MASLQTDTGWIKVHRKILDSLVFGNEKLFKFWLWCLLKATHEVHDQLVGFQNVTLEPGSFVFGRAAAAKELRMGESTVRNCLATLEKMGNVDIKSSNKFSIVTIRNWDTYQKEGQQKTNKRPTKNQQTTTNKNVKNVKNEKNVKNSLPDSEASKLAHTPQGQTEDFFKNPAQQEQAIALLVERGIPDVAARNEIQRFILYWTERNKTGTKQRWEMEKTFEVRRRLVTWLNRIRATHHKSSSPKGIVL